MDLFILVEMTSGSWPSFSKRIDGGIDRIKFRRKKINDDTHTEMIYYNTLSHNKKRKKNLHCKSNYGQNSRKGKENSNDLICLSKRVEVIGRACSID